MTRSHGRSVSVSNSESRSDQPGASPSEHEPVRVTSHGGAPRQSRCHRNWRLSAHRARRASAVPGSRAAWPSSGCRRTVTGGTADSHGPSRWPGRAALPVESVQPTVQVTVTSSHAGGPVTPPSQCQCPGHCAARPQGPGQPAGRCGQFRSESLRGPGPADSQRSESWHAGGSSHWHRDRHGGHAETHGESER